MINKKAVKQRVFSEFEPIIEKLLFKRGINSEKEKNKFFNPCFEKDLFNPFLLSDIEKAVERLMKAREENEKVCIFGDYDADGVTATAMLLDFLEENDWKVFSYIPHREKEGYGLNQKAVEKINQLGAKLIVTVDCGISNLKEIEFAKKKSIEVIVLDHHHVPSQLPKAFAIVNPKKKKEKYPEKELAGVGVAFKFIQALSSKLKSYDKNKNKWLLDLVAIGTIGDCVRLLGENRVLAKFGLIVVSKTRRKGLRQIFNVGKINIDENKIPSSWQISFQIAPRINAAGRMGHADLALELLRGNSFKDEGEIFSLALDIEKKNSQRQRITEKIIEEIEERLKQKELKKVIIETSPFWEKGIIGLAAGKITEKYKRPTILLKEEEGYLRGSGRSIGDFSLINFLEKHSQWFCRYGGHNQAAGLELKKEKFRGFLKEAFTFLEKFDFSSFDKKFFFEEKIDLDEVNLKLLKELELFEPFGVGNEKPIFLAEEVEILRKELVGKDRKHLKIWLKKSGGKNVFEAIGFGMSDKFFKISQGKKAAITFELKNDNWNGNNKIQLNIIQIENY